MIKGRGGGKRYVGDGLAVIELMALMTHSEGPWWVIPSDGTIMGAIRYQRTFPVRGLYCHIRPYQQGRRPDGLTGRIRPYMVFRDFPTNKLHNDVSSSSYR